MELLAIYTKAKISKKHLQRFILALQHQMLGYRFPVKVHCGSVKYRKIMKKLLFRTRKRNIEEAGCGFTKSDVRKKSVSKK